MYRPFLLRLFLLPLALLTALPTFSPAALAQSDQQAIEQLLRTRDREIKAIVGPSGTPSAQQRDRVVGVINNAFDFRAMSQAALGTTWGTLSDAQKNRFVEVFGGVVRQQSLENLSIYRAQVTYNGVAVNGTTATARTTAATRDSQGRTVNARVDYTLAKQGGTWRITDFAIDNVSTVQGYQRSFQQVIRQRGFDALLASLERRLQRGQG